MTPPARAMKVAVVVGDYESSVIRSTEKRISGTVLEAHNRMRFCTRSRAEHSVRFLLLAMTACVFGLGQPAGTKPKAIAFSTEGFQLLVERRQFFLQFVSGAKTQRLPIPRNWLIAPQEEKDEEDQAVSSFRFDKHVTSFPIGHGEIGIQLSSYDMMTEGSMQAAAGRDVFLIYDRAAAKLRPGHLNLGITKERVFNEGCWYARMVHFIVSDVNQDGYADIGTIKEEIKCPQGEEKWEGDSYEQHPLRWYLYTAGGWKPEDDGSGWPDTYVELPLIGIETSPVDFVGQILWRSADPSSWKSPPRYLPIYRKKLIADELERKSGPSLRLEKRK